MGPPGASDVAERGSFRRSDNDDDLAALARENAAAFKLGTVRGERSMVDGGRGPLMKQWGIWRHAENGRLKFHALLAGRRERIAAAIAMLPSEEASRLCILPWGFDAEPERRQTATARKRRDLSTTSPDFIVEFLDVLDDLRKRLTAIETEMERSPLPFRRHGDRVAKDVEAVNAKIAEVVEAVERFQQSTCKEPSR